MSTATPIENSLNLLWRAPSADQAGRKPSLTHDGIVAAAIALADAQGYEALSMRNLAKELNVGTMSLYRYVPSKSVLLNLMLDAIHGELQDAIGQDDDVALESRAWRETLESYARRYRDLLLSHPWVLQINRSRPVIGPQLLRDLEYCLSLLSDTAFADPEKISVLFTLDHYITGAAEEQLSENQSAAESGLTVDQFWEAQLPWLKDAIGSGKYPHMAALSEEAFSTPWGELFEIGLATLLDGTQARERRRAEQSRDSEENGSAQ